MKTVEFWLWWTISETSGRRYKTRHRMPAEVALARDPKAERVPGSCELRELPESIAEHALTSGFQTDPQP